MKAKHILLGLSATALAGLIGYNACKAEGKKAVLVTPNNVPEEMQPSVEIQPIPENPRITGDNETLTIEYSYNEGEFGTSTYIFQQFGKECGMRYIELRECPNARRNDGVQYGCNGTGMRDFGCDGIVDEIDSAQIGIGVNTALRSGREELFEAGKVEPLFSVMRETMELTAGISLENEIRKWKGQ